MSGVGTNYVCPICLGLQCVKSDATLIKPTDIIYQDELVTSFINSFFVDKNAGHVIVVPSKHFENIYDIRKKYAHRVFDVAQKVALAMKKAYKCDGITIRQNNEPAGEQHAFHYHFHISHATQTMVSIRLNLLKSASPNRPKEPCTPNGCL